MVKVLIHFLKMRKVLPWLPINKSKMKFKEFGVLVAGLGVAAITLQGCGKYEDGPGISLRSKDGRLTGEWKLTTVFGLVDETESFYEFDADGKFSYSSSYFDDFSEKDTTVAYTGVWEWDSGKESITISGGDDGPVEYVVKKLKNEEMTLSVTDPFFGLEIPLEFEKQ